MQHYAWVGMNPKESDNRELSKDIIARLPRFLELPTVLGVGEIGLNRVTRNEIATYTEQIELAAAHGHLVLIHTPHLEDKYKGTRISLDVLRRHPELPPGRVLVDHAEEHTIEAILEHGYWAGLTLYPQTKISPQRAVDVIEKYGPDRILVAGACDWGPSDPIAVPRFAMEMRRRRLPESLIHRVIFENPVTFLSQSPKFVAAGRRRGRRSSAARLTDPSCGWRSLSVASPAPRHRPPRRHRPRPRSGRSTSPTAPTSILATAGRRSPPTSGGTRRHSRHGSPRRALRPRPEALGPRCA